MPGKGMVRKVQDFSAIFTDFCTRFRTGRISNRGGGMKAAAKNATGDAHCPFTEASKKGGGATRPGGK